MSTWCNCSEGTLANVFGLIAVVVLVLILFIQVVLIGKLMDNCRYFLMFLFLVGSLLLPTLSGTFNRPDSPSGGDETTDAPSAASSRVAAGDMSQTMTTESTELRKRRQKAPELASSRKTSGPVALPVLVSNSAQAVSTARTTSIDRAPAIAINRAPAESRGPLASQSVPVGTSSSPQTRFQNVSQPLSLSGQTNAPAGGAPQPVVMRGNISSDVASVDRSRSANLNQGTYNRQPTPLRGAGPISPTLPQTDGSSIRSAGFSALTPQLKNPTMPPEMASSNEVYRNLFGMLEQVIHAEVMKVRPCVVHIEARVYKDSSGGRRREVEETGCGIIAYLQEQFFVITNAHVAGHAVSADSVQILMGDKRTIYPRRILTCPEIDIALLELDPATLPGDILQGTGEVCVARFGNSDTVAVTNTVFSIGSPFGLSGSISRGVVSGRQRRRIPLGNAPNQIQDFLQTDAAINPGNSGGPLVNYCGEVIGIVTAIATNSGGSEGVAFALPINNVLVVANQLIVSGVFLRPYMGVELDPEFDAKSRAKFGIDRPLGTRVLEVKPRSPAEQVGLMPNDVILRYNGTTVEDDQHLVQLIGLSRIGESPRLSVLRGRQEIVLTPFLIRSSSAAVEQ